MSHNTADLWEELIGQMRARQAKGLAQYGVPVTADPAVDWLTHLEEELLDALVYLRALRKTRARPGDAAPADVGDTPSPADGPREPCLSVEEALKNLKIAYAHYPWFRGVGSASDTGTDPPTLVLVVQVEGMPADFFHYDSYAGYPLRFGGPPE